MRLNYNPDGWSIDDEEIQVPSSSPYIVETEHDNISEVEIYTQPGKGGTMLQEGVDYTVDYDGAVSFRKSAITFTSNWAGFTLYVWYKSIGDVVEADDINNIENKLNSLSFLDLTDTPGSYASHAGKVLSVKQDESGLEFIDAPSGGGGGGDGVGGILYLYEKLKGVL